MKRLALAAFLILVSGPAFTQTNQAYNQKTNGQNDCQCSGVGMSSQVTTQFKSVKRNGSALTISDKADMTIPFIWFKVIQHYFDQLHSNEIQKRNGR